MPMHGSQPERQTRRSDDEENLYALPPRDCLRWAFIGFIAGFSVAVIFAFLLRL